MCSCVESCANWFLLVTNSLTFVFALVVLSVSIWILVDQPSFLKVLNVTDDVIGGFDLKIYQSATIILLVISILVIIITFFGCCGASKENRCLLATYFVCDVLLLIGVGVGAYFVFTGNLKALQTPFIEALKKYDDTSSVASDKTLVKAWDSFQQDFVCCGVDSFHDWAEYNPLFQGALTTSSTSRPNYNNQEASSSSRSVPESCCNPSMDQETCAQRPTSNNGVYAVGCFRMVVDEIKDHEAIIGGVALGVVVVMVANAIISLYMATCGYSGPAEWRPNRREYRRP